MKNVLYRRLAVSLTLIASLVQLTPSTSSLAATSWSIVQLETDYAGRVPDRTCILWSSNVVQCTGPEEYNPSIKTNVAQISLGAQHGCSLLLSGTISCKNSFEGGVPAPSLLSSVKQIATGNFHTCALLSSSVVKCWGANGSGQSSPGTLEGLAIKNIYANVETSCALSTTDILFCWGSSPGLSRESMPGVKSISLGVYGLCGINSEDKAFCRGSIPAPPGNLGAVTQISADYYHACALKVNGELACWGTDKAYGYSPIKSVPLEMGTITSVTTGYDHDCVVLNQSSVYCWYLQGNQQYPTYSSWRPRLPQITGLTVVGDSTAGSLVVAGGFKEQNGTSYFYEWLRKGVRIAENQKWLLLGVQDIGSQISFRVVASRTGFNYTDATSEGITVSRFKIAAADSHSCTIVTAVNDLRCWGSDDKGQIDNPDDIGTVTSFSAVGDDTCAISSNGKYKCWGSGKDLRAWRWNDDHEFLDLAAGENQTCLAYPWTFGSENKIGTYCLDSSGNLQVDADQNANFAAFGDSGSLTCSLWYQGSVQDWRCEGPEELKQQDYGLMVSSGSSHACKIAFDLTLSCWGSNQYGQLDIPADLGPVRAVSAGSNHTCAIKVSSEVKCWGSNEFGQAETPPNLGSVAQVSAGGDHTCVVDNSSKIICWGNSLSSSTPNLASTLPPKASEFSLSQENDEEFRVTISPKIRPSDGQIFWKVKSVVSKKTLCEIKYPETSCLIPGVIGKNYQIAVISGNEAGESDDSAKYSFKFCPIGQPTISARMSNSVVAIGGTSTLSGKLENLCEPQLKHVSYRFIEAGKSWTAWKQIEVTAQGTFKKTLNFSVNTKIQVRADTRAGKIFSPEILTGVRIKFALPLSFYWTPKKFKGFNQGGEIVVKFGGDKVFNGSCTVLASNETAFNFALVYVGSESTFTTFKVKNGSGSGKVVMKWNGKVKVSALCSDPKYADVFDFRTPTFRASF